MTEAGEDVKKVVIIGSGPAAHTAAIYTARAELKPTVFEGFMANGIAPGGQLTTTAEVENYPGFPSIMGGELMQKFREQSVECGAKILTETVTKVDLSTGRPFEILGEDGTRLLADSVVIATGAVARRLNFKGSGEGDGFWNKGISACAVCDGASPIFRDKPIAVVGGGDSAVEEAVFLTKYGSKVYIIHRRDELRASKILRRRAESHPKIEMVWSHVVEEAFGDDSKKLAGVKLKSTKTGEIKELEVSGLFFAIGHDPATSLFKGQLDLDEDGYIVTEPDSTTTSCKGVFACGDVQDKKWRQAVTAAGTGCMAALEVEHFLGSLESEPEAENGATLQTV
ncbi:hypothetical protein BSKO_04365 [Bryopsis sp. KO-2023]|nr:hypothetical protein BSKO_04365 [Bryopsis sp. KO-2023]